MNSIHPPHSGRDTYSDTLRPGLHLRVGQRKAAWMYEKRVKGGPKRKHTLGTYCTWSTAGERSKASMELSEARAAALEIENEAIRGIDRIADAQQARLNAERAAASLLTVEQVIVRYAELKLANLTTGEAVEHELRKALGAHLSRPFKELTRADLQVPIDQHAGAGRVPYANRTRAYLRTFTGWAARREYLDNDIGFALEGAGREMPRDRVLGLPEVGSIYEATYEIGPLFGPLFRLLLLTGQRRGEIACMKWSNVNLSERQIVMEGRQTKNRRPHITHLSQAAFDEIEVLHVNRGESDFVFTTTGVTPTSGISKAKRRLDGILGEDFQPWRLHDFRRAMATALAHAGVPEGVVDRIQNHAASGSAPSAVARVYQQSDLLPQRAAALDRWSEKVTKEGAEVVRLERKE